MLSYFENYFANGEFIKDIFLIFLGAAFSYVGMKIKEGNKNLRNRKKLKKSSYKFAQEGIVSLVNAYPVIKSKNMELVKTNEIFKLYCEELSHSGMTEDIIFNNKSLEDLAMETQISDLPELIKRHKEKVKEEFEQSVTTSRPLYNNEKFGIRSIVLPKTEDRYEDSKIIIRFYTTDYYTHKVMRSVYQELVGRKDDIACFSRCEEVGFTKYYPFLTSFGVNSLLYIDAEDGSQAIFIPKRSKYVANMERDQWHVSMNEGLSITDVDEDDKNKISLNRCVKRGYREELGIKDKVEDKIYNYEFGDLFITKEKFEVGISSYAYTKMTREELDICYLGAEDSSMETVGYRLLNNDTKEILKFIKNNDLTEAAKYCLTMKLSRNI